MKYLYSTGIYIYNFLLLIASLFNKKAAAMLRGRRDTFDKIKQSFKNGDRVFWFHCASLGEFEQGRPVIERLKSEEPEVKILLSFYSPSGYEIRNNYDKADCVVYMPADTVRNANKLINLARPEKAVFIKYEFWYNFLAVLQKRNIPVYLISGIFRSKQPFFRWYGKYFINILRRFNRLYIQDVASAELLKAHDIHNYTISGDTRFDRVVAISKNADKIPLIERFKDGKRLIVAGSTWPPEEEIIAEYLNKEGKGIKFIIAPHNIGASNIERLENILKVSHMKYSQVKVLIPDDIQVLIIDSIGLLSSIYRYADIAVIGGGFGRGIHNILEAATWSVPVMFGPRYSRFREAVDLVKMGGARVFNNYSSFVSAVNGLIGDPELLEEAGRINLSYINSNLGATEMITAKLLT
ncbi:MAG: glycosyltransferase N-terminal domain-containing protein [Bacteroidota bacterium]|nr:glycosyltransferase N-terminal domain-containing protein [Bacteroidota bacterium]